MSGRVIGRNSEEGESGGFDPGNAFYAGSDQVFAWVADLRRTAVVRKMRIPKGQFAILQWLGPHRLEVSWENQAGAITKTQVWKL